MSTGRLSVVATPIGNLGDVTGRALETLRACDFICCEDTRVTAKLLAHYEIKKPLRRADAHSRRAWDEIMAVLSYGGHVAIVTDAGTPGISDPGNELVAAVLSEFGSDVKIEPIPGPSAIIAALSIAGFPTQQFLFLGYPPAKHKRAAFFREVADCSYTVGLYESVHRIGRTLKELETACGLRYGIVVRELTKLHETVYRGTISELLEQVMSDVVKGEYTIVIAPPSWQP